jgi:hypothetical protein
MTLTRYASVDDSERWQPNILGRLAINLVVAGGCDTIVTYNIGDFGGAQQFGIRVVRPLEFLRETGILP